MLALLNEKSMNRIVGGAYINITFVPYMISLMLNGQHMCGGGIVNKNWAVTAAHCLIDFRSRRKDLGVRSGSSFIDEGGVIHSISTIILHRNYDYDTSDYDLAVIKVNPPFEFNNQTRPLTLATNDSISKDYGLVAGWGYFLNFDPVLSRQLQYVYVPRTAKKECIEDYSNRYVVTDRQVCYGFRRGGEDACKGDSGGPMVNEDKVLIGVTSWGDGCAKPNSPGIYTDAILLRDWIADKTKDAGDNSLIMKNTQKA